MTGRLGGPGWKVGLLLGGLYVLFFLGSSYPLADGVVVVFGGGRDMVYMQPERPWFREVEPALPGARAEDRGVPAGAVLQALAESDHQSLAEGAPVQKMLERLVCVLEGQEVALVGFEGSLEESQRSWLATHGRSGIRPRRARGHGPPADDPGVLAFLLADLELSLGTRLARAPVRLTQPARARETRLVNSGVELVQAINALLLSQTGRPSRVQLQQWTGWVRELRRQVAAEEEVTGALMGLLSASCRQRAAILAAEAGRDDAPAQGLRILATLRRKGGTP